MKVKCINNKNKKWKDIKLPFTIGKIYDGIFDNEFVNIIQLYVIDDNGDEMTIASLDILGWSGNDNKYWYKDRWFKEHFKIVG